MSDNVARRVRRLIVRSAEGEAGARADLRRLWLHADNLALGERVAPLKPSRPQPGPEVMPSGASETP